VKARHHVGQGRHACDISACTFTASRKDNLRQHRSKYHGIELSSGQLQQREEAGRVDFIEASHNQDISILRSLSVGCLPGEGTSTRAVFLQAATVGNLFIIEASLDAGMDVNIVGDDRSTALHCAARAGQNSAVRYLLEHGADREVENKMQRSPLHEALLSQSWEMVDLLFRDGAKLRDSEITRSCLARCGSMDILNLCLAHIEESVINDMLYSILASASRIGDIALVIGLLSLANKNADDPNTIRERSASPNLETCLDPLRVGLNWQPQTNDSRGFSPLHFAAAEGHLGIVKKLVYHRFDLNKRIQGSTPVHLAARRGHTDVVEFLLNQKTIEIKQTTGYRSSTLLHLAVSHGKTEVARLLLNRVDFNVGQKDWIGRTSLHLAAPTGHLEVLQLLLQHSHHSEHRCLDGAGRSPLQLAATHGHWDAAQFLLDHEEIQRPQGPTRVVQQKLRTPLEILKSLLEHTDFSDVNLSGGYSTDGLLHVAIRKGAFECIQFLLCHENIDINVMGRPPHGSPLSLAAALGQADTVKLLLQHKNIDLERSGIGLHVLYQARTGGHGEIVDLLLLALGLKYTDNNAPSHGSIYPIADHTAIVHPQLESFAIQDLQVIPYIFENECSDTGSCSVESDSE
jgi:ankyrin repeat protein